MGRISESTKALLTGTTVKAQADSKKSAPVTDDDGATITASNDAVIKAAANAVKAGTQVDGGSKLVDDLKIAHFASSIACVKARTSKITKAELEAELGHPDLGGPESIAATMRINRRGEPK
ncbi:MAG: hypothetical protein WB438_04220 [Candidatus Cybelea sp.]